MWAWMQFNVNKLLCGIPTLRQNIINFCKLLWLEQFDNCFDSLFYDRILFTVVKLCIMCVSLAPFHSMACQNLTSQFITWTWRDWFPWLSPGVLTTPGRQSISKPPHPTPKNVNCFEVFLNTKPSVNYCFKVLRNLNSVTIGAMKVNSLSNTEVRDNVI